MRWRVGLQFLAIVVIVSRPVMGAWTIGERAVEVATGTVLSLDGSKRRIMVRLNRIYTRTGDDGTTGLGDGERRPKFDRSRRRLRRGRRDQQRNRPRPPRNAASPNARSRFDRRDAEAHPERSVRSRRRSLRARAEDGREQQGRLRRLRIVAEPGRMARARRSMSSTPNSSPLRSFVLPGGTPAAAALHQARDGLPPGGAAHRRARRHRGRDGRRDGDRLHQPSVGLSCSSPRALPTIAAKTTYYGFPAQIRTRSRSDLR